MMLPLNDRPGGQVDHWQRAEHLVECLTASRTEMLRHLARGPIRVTDLAAEVELERSQVSKYLAPMLALELVSYQACGHDHIYRLNNAAAVMRQGEWIVVSIGIANSCEAVLRVWDPRFDLAPRHPRGPSVGR